MHPPSEFRSPDTYARIRSLLTTLQLRLDLHAEAHGCNETDAAFLEAVHQDIADLADLVRERRLVLREVQPPGCPVPTNYLARSS